MKIKVLLVDNNKLFRELLTERFSLTADIEVVGEAEYDQEILEKVRQTRPDIVLMEIAFPGMSGAEIAQIIFMDYPDIKVVALTTHNEKNYIKGMLDAKAWGYLLKNCTFDQLHESIKQIHSGKKHVSTDIQGILIEDYLDRNAYRDERLTSRETEILKLLAEGKSIREISEELFISIKTTGTHKQKIFDKLQFENMAQLIKYAMKNGII